jgi:hypothetical protein
MKTIWIVWEIDTEHSETNIYDIFDDFQAAKDCLAFLKARDCAKVSVVEQFSMHSAFVE